MSLFDVLPAGLNVVGNLASSALSYLSVRDTNRMKMDLANTAHQREVRDLRRAGLNPILSGTGGSGAAVPNLESQKFENPTKDVASDYATAKRVNIDAETAKLQQELLKAQILKTQADTDVSWSQGVQIRANTLYTDQQVRESLGRMGLLEKQTALTGFNAESARLGLKSDEAISQIWTMVGNSMARILGSRQSTQTVDGAFNRVVKEITGVDPVELTEAGVAKLKAIVDAPARLYEVVKGIVGKGIDWSFPPEQRRSIGLPGQSYGGSSNAKER